MMAENSKIEWTDATWNPWHGCKKVSKGCKNCYMFREKKQYGQDPDLVVRGKTTFNKPLKWKEPKLIFTCSWSDFFIEEADEWRDEAWDIIRRTPQHTYQILTKRPERIADHLPADWGEGHPNVWLGVSVENQAMANERIPVLLNVPGAVRFISAEPLLDEISLEKWIGEMSCEHCRVRFWGDTCPQCGRTDQEDPEVGFFDTAVVPYANIDWVIGGFESGPKRRGYNLEHAYKLLEECRLTHNSGAHGEWDIKFFMKQIDKVQPIPNDLLIRQFPEPATA